MWYLNFVIGAVVGSAVNSLVWRLPRGLSWLRGRSQCPHCEYTLRLLDLVPVVSYILLRGRCRHCRKPIGKRYLLVELLLGLGFGLIFISGWSLTNILLAIGLSVSVGIAVMDWETQLVSEWLVVIWAGAVLLNLITTGQLNLLSSLLGIGLGIGVIGGLWLVSRGQAMGSGDIEIAAVIGLWLGGAKTGMALWMAFVSGAVVGCLMLLTGKSKLKSKIAFGTFLVLGAWVAWAFGDTMITWANFRF